MPMSFSLGQGHSSRSSFSKNGKKLKNWPYLGYFTYRLHTYYQGTTQLSAFNDLSADDLDPVKVKFSQKLVKCQRTGHISEAISSTDFILGTNVQPNKAHSMTHVPMTLTKGQGQRSRSNFPKNDKKN